VSCCAAWTASCLLAFRNSCCAACTSSSCKHKQSRTAAYGIKFRQCSSTAESSTYLLTLLGGLIYLSAAAASAADVWSSVSAQSSCAAPVQHD
jgi:hypothetical protein